MRVAAFVLGLVGGILGLGASMLVVEIASIGVGISAGADQEFLLISILAFAAVITAVVGASFALVRKRKWAGSLLLVSGLLGFLPMSTYWLPSGILLLIASLLAFLDKRDGSQIPVASSSLSQ